MAGDEGDEVAPRCRLHILSEASVGEAIAQMSSERRPETLRGCEFETQRTRGTGIAHHTACPRGDEACQLEVPYLHQVSRGREIQPKVWL